MKESKTKKIIVGIIIFVLAILYCFPVLNMILTGFKTEEQAAEATLIFAPTLETYINVFGSDYMKYLNNSLFQVILGTIITMIVSVFATFTIVFSKFKKMTTAKSIYNWFFTTILLPPVAVLLPLYLIFTKMHLTQTPISLLVLYVGFHTPIAIWLLYSFFKDIPKDIVEAARMDGSGPIKIIFRIIIPMALPGIVTAALLVGVFIWNEFFLSFNLSSPMTSTLPIYMQKFSEQQGLFIAKLCASTTLATSPAIVAGWLSQKALIKGLTSGAVKG